MMPMRSVNCAGRDSDLGLLSAGIDRSYWIHDSVVFCSPQKKLFRAEEKASEVLVFYMPALDEEELLALAAPLPRYQVRIESNLQLAP